MTQGPGGVHLRQPLNAGKQGNEYSQYVRPRLRHPWKATDDDGRDDENGEGEAADDQQHDPGASGLPECCLGASNRLPSTVYLGFGLVFGVVNVEKEAGGVSGTARGG